VRGLYDVARLPLNVPATRELQIVTREAAETN
jgi:hypothetical protein